MDNANYVFERVMIVDDSTVDRYTASYIMKKNAFSKHLLEFDMATKAIAFLKEHQDDRDMLPQVILLDISMPEMDGFQFLEQLELLPECVKATCCIVMLSSSLNPNDHERAEKNIVVKKFLNKPLSKDKLEIIKEFREQMGPTISK